MAPTGAAAAGIRLNERTMNTDHLHNPRPRPPAAVPQIQFGGNAQLATLLRAIGDDLANPSCFESTMRATSAAHGRTLRALAEALKVTS